MKTYHPLGKQQYENTNDVQLKLFSQKQLWQSNAKKKYIITSAQKHPKVVRL